MDTRRMNTQEHIWRRGWECEAEVSPIHGCRMYRAFQHGHQGGFKTLWRKTPEEVLADVQAIVEARRKQPENTPF